MGKDDLEHAENTDKQFDGEEVSQDKALSQDELDTVSGGAFWFGEDAPDGHEIGCFMAWYDDWDEFDSTHSSTYCKGSHGRKHEFGEPFTLVQGYGIFRVETVYKQCKLCGYKIDIGGTYH